MPGNISQRRTADARQGRQQDQLIERGLVFEAGGKVDDIFGFHFGIDKPRRAAAGGALAEAVPVIALHDPGLMGAHRGNNVAAGVAALGVDIDPVGKQAAGAVELLAVEPPPIAIR
ncbi:hypothetical protein D3C87_1386180 [compost metagenome]